MAKESAREQTKALGEPPGMSRAHPPAAPRQKTLLAAIGVAMLLAAQVLSAACLSHEADHDCAGHDCPICAVIQQCASNFQLLGSGYVPALSMVTECAVASDRIESDRTFFAIHPTLVSLKVRLDE